MNSRDRRKAIRAAFHMGLRTARDRFKFAHIDGNIREKSPDDVDVRHRRNPFKCVRFVLAPGMQDFMSWRLHDAFNAGWEAFKP